MQVTWMDGFLELNLKVQFFQLSTQQKIKEFILKGILLFLTTEYTYETFFHGLISSFKNPVFINKLCNFNELEIEEIKPRKQHICLKSSET